MNKKEIKRIIELLDKNTNVRVTTYNKMLLKNYVEALNYTRRELQTLFNKLGNTPTFVEASIRLKNIEKQLDDKIVQLTNKTNIITKKAIDDVYVFNYNGFQSVLNKTIGTSVSFGLISKKSSEASVINPFSWQNSNIKYSSNLLKGIKNSVSVGILTGKSYDNILKDVTKKFNITAGNALRIIKTETHRNENAARLDSLENAQRIGSNLGYKIQKVWNSYIDDRTRQTHIDADGQVADDNGYFNVGGENIEAPGFGSPENTINCRCTVTINIIDNKNTE